MAALVHHSLPATRPSCLTPRPSPATAPAAAATAAAAQLCVQLQWLQHLQQRRSRRPAQRSVCCQASLRPLEVSSSIAAARAAESARPDALFQDPYAAALCGTQPSSSSSSSSSVEAAMDVIATMYSDESVLNAMEATSTNSIQSGDYRQVVLLGDGFDSRPFRLPWPPGTLLFSVAPAEVHEQAEARLAAAQPPAHVRRGCLLRRVNMNIKPAQAAAAAAAAGVAAAGSDSSGADSSNSREGEAQAPSQQQQQQQQSTVFREQLSRAGFRGDRLSVWVLQGLHGQGLGAQPLRQLLAEVADCAAFHSLIVGELPGPLSRQHADNLLAEAGLLGAVYDYATADAGQYKRWQEAIGGAAGSDASDASGSGDASSSSSSSSEVAPRWIAAGQQLRLSLAQMGIYDEWSAEFEEADFGDDFIGNVS